MKKIECFFLILFILVILLCGKRLWDYYRQSEESQEKYQQVEEIAFPSGEEETDLGEPGNTNTAAPKDDYDYSSLLQINPECIGWLKIEGTDISYPVVQGTDNSFYLSHDFLKKRAICGCLFVDFRNDLSAKEEHVIIYGHQMKDGSMFKQLNGYKKEDFFLQHNRITFYIKSKKYQYMVAAVFVTNAEQSRDYYNYLHKETRVEQMEYLKEMEKYQQYSTGVKLEPDDELLSLSTCEYSSSNGRLIVLARRLDE